MATNENSACVNVFRVNGPLDHTIDLQQFVPNFKLVSVDLILVPKLDWQDREFDTQ